MTDLGNGYQILVTHFNVSGMGRNTAISLGDHFESFADSLVKAGRFKNASEVIRAGLKLLEEEEAKLLMLQNAIHEGINNGMAKDFDPAKHLANLKSSKAKKHGK
jgi:antitoxin ParD1/3/4